MSSTCIRHRSHVLRRWMGPSRGGGPGTAMSNSSIQLQFAESVGGNQPQIPQWGGGGSAAVRYLSTTKDLSSKLTTAVITSKKKDKDPPPQSSTGSGGSTRNPTPTSPPPREENRTRLVGKKSTPPPTKSSDSNPPRDVPRRIVVVKEAAPAAEAPPAASDNNNNNSYASNNEQLKQKQRVGLVKRRFPLEHEITDSAGKIIWVPAKTVVENDHILPTQLPQIRATAWLDPSMYCRGGGKSIAGTDAARKLLRGKKDLMELLGHAVHNSKFAGKQQSFVLQGHGVPPQMLQHHVDFAASLLTRLSAAEVSFKQFNVTQHHNSMAASEAVRDIRWTHVRDVVTGENRAVPWPLDDGDHWEDDLQLYWTVMNRIATRLGLAVLLKRPVGVAVSYEDSHKAQSSTNYYNLPVTPSNSLLKTPPHHWKVEFSRRWHFAPEQLPPGQFHLYPVLEWAPLDGVAAPGHVCIRLQGVSSRTGKDEALPVSLCFDACFRTNHTTSYGE